MAASNQIATLLPRADTTSAGPVNTHVNDGVQINNTISAGTGNTQYNAVNQYFQTNTYPDPTELDAQFRRDLCSSCAEIDRTNLLDTKGEAVDGTREWVLTTEEYKAWLQDDSSPLLWIWGGPGKGKTMLSIFLSQELEKENKTLYFFCSAQDEKRSTAVGILRSLLWHLTALYPNLTTMLRKDLDSTTEFAFSSRDTLWRAFERLMREKDYERLYCIIDGLDECDDSSRLWLTKKLESVNTRSVASKLKLIVVSRELLGFKDAIQLRLDSDYCEQVNSSVKAFIEYKVETIFQRFTLNKTLRQEVKDKLSKRAKGTYLYVGFAAIELSSQVTINGIFKTLEELPAGLSPLYSRLLRDIEPNQQQFVSRILGFVSLARRPLSLEELASATGCRPTTGALSPKENIRDLIRGFGPLFRISDYGQLIRCCRCRECFQMPSELDLTSGCPRCRYSDGYIYEYEHRTNREPLSMYQLKHIPPPEVETVTLVHESVRDFLLDATLFDGTRITRFTLDQMHFKFASACIDALVASDALESGFASYAAVFWSFHARNSGMHARKLLSHPSSFFDKTSELRSASWRRSGHAEDIPRLHMACLLGYTAWVESILGSWEAKLSNLLLLARKDVNGATPLHAAVLSGDPKIVSLLLQHTSIIKAFIDIVHNDKTALYMAASRGNREIAQLLLQHKANPNIECHKGDTSLRIAARHGYLDVVKLLLFHKANVHASAADNGTALHQAANSGHTDVAAILLRHGADVDARRHASWGHPSKETETALHIAVTDGNEALASLLLQHKADPNLASEHGKTAVHVAATSGSEALLKVFLDKVDVNTIAEMGTVLRGAIFRGHTGVLKLLLEHRADVNAMTQDGTALHAAAWSDRTDVVKMLLEYGANVNAKLHNGGTALHRAAVQGNLAVVTVLLEHGADIHAKNRFGQTALSAMMTIHQDLCRVGNGSSDPKIHARAMIRTLLEHGGATI